MKWFWSVSVVDVAALSLAFLISMALNFLQAKWRNDQHLKRLEEIEDEGAIMGWAVQHAHRLGITYAQLVREIENIKTEHRRKRNESH